MSQSRHTIQPNFTMITKLTMVPDLNMVLN